MLILAALAIAFVPLPAKAGETSARRTIRIQAGRYAYSPAEIQVNPGDIVTLELASTDVTHGLYLDGYGFSLTAEPGQTATLTFVADRPGSFRFRCNVTCGAMHPFMIGSLQVGSDLSLWRGLALMLLTLLSAPLLARSPVIQESA